MLGMSGVPVRDEASGPAVAAAPPPAVAAPLVEDNNVHPEHKIEDPMANLVSYAMEATNSLFPVEKKNQTAKGQPPAPAVAAASAETTTNSAPSASAAPPAATANETAMLPHSVRNFLGTPEFRSLVSAMHGIIPLDTPAPIAMSGYQIGMIPTKFLEKLAKQSLDDERRSSSRRKKSSRKRHRKKRRRATSSSEDQHDEDEDDENSSDG